MKNILVALVENKPGVLNRVASLFRRRNFNIDSLTVGSTQSPDIARMTIVVEQQADQVRNQLQKLIDVVEVEDLTHTPSLSRDLALIKVAVDSASRIEVLHLADIFRAKVVDTSPTTMILEVTGDEQKIWAISEMLSPYGILEMVRTGAITLARGRHVLGCPDNAPSHQNGSSKSAQKY